MPLDNYHSHNISEITFDRNSNIVISTPDGSPPFYLDDVIRKSKKGGKSKNSRPNTPNSPTSNETSSPDSVFGQEGGVSSPFRPPSKAQRYMRRSSSETFQDDYSLSLNTRGDRPTYPRPESLQGSQRPRYVQRNRVVSGESCQTGDTASTSLPGGGTLSTKASSSLARKLRRSRSAVPENIVRRSDGPRQRMLELEGYHEADVMFHDNPAFNIDKHPVYELQAQLEGRVTPSSDKTKRHSNSSVASDSSKTSSKIEKANKKSKRLSEDLDRLSVSKEPLPEKSNSLPRGLFGGRFSLEVPGNESSGSRSPKRKSPKTTPDQSLTRNKSKSADRNSYPSRFGSQPRKRGYQDRLSWNGASYRSKSNSNGSSRKSRSSQGQTSASRLSVGRPRITAEFAAQLERERVEREGSRGIRDLVFVGRLGQAWSAFKRYPVTNERLPTVLFIVVGALLLIMGIIRIAATYWSQFGSDFWSGFLVFTQGCLAIWHKRNYFSRLKNMLYMLNGVLSSAAVLVAVAFSLRVLVPTVHILQHYHNADNVTLKRLILSNVTFSLKSSSYTYENIDMVRVNLNLALDVISLVLLTISLHCQTSTIVTLDNHWEACYDMTAKCDHRGNPAYFNPVEQMTLGQVATFVGIIQVVLWNQIRLFTSLEDWNHHGSPIWSGAVAILAGLVSTIYGKRTDLQLVGVIAIVVEVAALAASIAAVVFSTVSFALALQNRDKINKSGIGNVDADVGVLCFFHAAFVIITIVSVVYIVGIVFRQIKTLACNNSDSRA